MKGKRDVKWSHSISEMKKNLMEFAVNRNNYHAIRTRDNENERVRR
jgi:hypothetical protein